MNNTYNGLRDYFVAISKYPLLSQNEETELGYRIKEGDGNAREQLINCNLKLVVTIAKKYKGLTCTNLQEYFGYFSY